MIDVVSVRVAGREFKSWQSVTINRSIESACRSFELTASGLETAEGIPIFAEDEIEIRIDKDLVLTGYVEFPNPSDDAEGFEFTIAGRSRTCDIVDCSNIAKRTHQNRTMLQIARRMCDPYGVEVVAGSADPLLSDPIKRFTVEPAEIVYDALERAAALRAVLLFDDERGRLVLQVGAKGRFPLAIDARLHRDTLPIAGKILSADSGVDSSKLYSEYRIKGQRISDDNDNGSAVAIVGGSATADGTRRKRVRTLTAKSSISAARAKTRAKWESANAFGRAASYRATVRGWRDQAGELWTPGTLIEVDDPKKHRWQGQFLVVSVTHNKDSEGGTTSDITVAPEGGYYAELPDSPRKGISAWRVLGQ